MAQRDDPVVATWDEKTEVLPGVVLHRIGGHFPGSAVVHFAGADGRGVVLSGDTVAGTPDEHWVSFMRSFPNKIPLSAPVVVADRVLQLDFDRLYDNFGGQVIGDAAGWVRRSADRYIAWVEGTSTTSPGDQRAPSAPQRSRPWPVGRLTAHD